MAFSNDDRRLLLHTQGIGPRMLQRLDEAGFDSLQTIHELGVEHVIAAVSRHLPGCNWRNRQTALRRALAAWSAAGADSKMRTSPSVSGPGAAAPRATP